MKKKKADFFYLSAKEEASMKVLWESKEPLSASEIAERIPNRTWPASSIQSILRGLEKKGAIEVADIVRLGKAYGRVFRPALSANDYVAMQFDRYYQDDGGGCRPMISALLGSGTKAKKKEAVIRELKSLLEKYGEEGG